MLTAIRTVILDYCLDTFYKKIKTNFSVHDQSELKYLQDCYSILCKIHDISGEIIDCTFEEYCLMYYDSLGMMGYDYTHGKTSIFNKDRLELVYNEILNSDGEFTARFGDSSDFFEDDDDFEFDDDFDDDFLYEDEDEDD